MAFLVICLRSHCLEVPLVFLVWLGACPWDWVFGSKEISSESVKIFYFIWIYCLIPSTIKTKVVLTIYVIQCTIFKTFESIIFWSYYHWCSNGDIKIKIKEGRSENWMTGHHNGLLAAVREENLLSLVVSFVTTKSQPHCSQSV